MLYFICKACRPEYHRARAMLEIRVKALSDVRHRLEFRLLNNIASGDEISCSGSSCMLHAAELSRST